jgi:hypothetical protein
MGLVETLATETLDTGAKVLESPGGTQRSKYFSSVSSVERSRSWKFERDSDSSPVKRLTPLQVRHPSQRVFSACFCVINGAVLLKRDKLLCCRDFLARHCDVCRRCEE